MHIALITYKDLPHLTASDQLLNKALKDQGFKTSIVSWDAQVNWRTFDLVIIRSCWDYHFRIKDFLEWIKMLEKLHINVQNPISIIKNNYKKTYLQTLQNRGVSIIPTEFVSQDTIADIGQLLLKHNWEEIIIKPAIGASAYKIEKLKNDENAISKIEKLAQSHDILIQPFMKEIKQGEVSLIFFNSLFSHAILKTPAKNDFRSNYEFQSTEELYYPDKTMIKQAEFILSCIESKPLYARVDGLIVDNTFVLNELELIEPDLFFNLYPKAANTMASIIKEKQ
jgi:glutathione synthase/RimK-type ligase-like ATP-grasp enzyme